MTSVALPRVGRTVIRVRRSAYPLPGRRFRTALAALVVFLAAIWPLLAP
ncbi:hypothetical protein [Plantactinospora sp. GCM10030261]